MRFSKWGALLALAVASAGAAAACGSSQAGSGFDTQGDDAGVDACTSGCGSQDATLPPDDGPVLVPDDAAVTNEAGTQLSITPADVTLTIDSSSGLPIPTQQYTALIGSATVGAQFTVDRGEIGAIGVSSGLFTPTGGVGGKATITASYNGKTATTTVSVKLIIVQMGDPNPPDAGGGTGGVGGVGGFGEGAAANASQVAILNGTPTADPVLTFLYPYDKTVWPRGLLAPLMQWEIGSYNFDALYIHLTEKNYEYKGYFQKPTFAPQLVNHPIPQSVWKQLASSNEGEDVSVSLTFSDSTQNKAFGPISETWKIAGGPLKGTVYYNSYGTNLVQNECCTKVAGARFGGATLAIRGGSTSPELVAGTTTSNNTGCRVCHSVSANGSTLVTQHGDNYGASSMYGLTAGNVETAIPGNPVASLTYPALSPDGKLMLTGPHSGNAALVSLATGSLGQPIATTGAPSTFTPFTPSFSPDGKHVAYDDVPTSKLAVIDFNSATNQFSNALALYTPPSGKNVFWPTFFPTNDALVFQLELTANGRDTAGTRSLADSGNGLEQGAHGELWWVDVKTQTSHRLDNANGVGYLPLHPTAFTGEAALDATLNYEPTVNPVPSGGYAWVVFTSRRRYGNVATINPFHSDPRYADISTIANATPKKLWVAAIDLNAAPGTDPSHPAFYLPGQELLAGNARGFWVVDPCKQDNSSCETGDECCGGFCRPAGDGGALVCTAQQPSCAQEFEKCTVTADCCGASVGIQCINQRCARPTPQ